MKKGYNEKKVLKEIGVKKATEITENHADVFSKILPKVNTKVAKEILKQVPEFTKLALGIVDNYKEIVLNNSKANDKNTEAYFKTCNKILDSLEKQLNKKFVSNRQKEKIINKMIEVADKMDKKDTENKKWTLIREFSIGALFLTILGALVSMLTFGKIKIK